MAKQGMKRPDETHPRKKNDLPPVPELQGKAKRGKEKAEPLDNGVGTSGQTEFHREVACISAVCQMILSDSLKAGSSSLCSDRAYPLALRFS